MCLNENTPEGKGEHFLSKTNSWNKKPDATGLLLQDWGVFSFFEAFLKDWDVIINSLNKKNACKWTARATREKKPKRQKTKGKNHAP